MSSWARKFYEAIAAGNLDMSNDPWMRKIYQWFVDNGFPDAAADISYNNTISGLTASDLQAAIDELSASPGGGSWQVAGTWTHSADVPEVSFTDLGSYQDLVFIGRDITTSISGFRLLQVSVNNGSSYFSTSGDYISLATSGTTSNDDDFGTHLSSGTAARTLVAEMSGTNASSASRVSRDGSGLIKIFVGSSLPINAIRVINSGGGNLTGGSIVLMGRT